MQRVCRDEDPIGGSGDVSEESDALTEGGGVVVLREPVLDQPVWDSLNGPHAHLAQRHGGAVRYPIDVAPFAAVAPGGESSGWGDLAALVGPAGTAVVIDTPPPLEWEIVRTVGGVQM